MEHPALCGVPKSVRTPLQSANRMKLPQESQRRLGSNDHLVFERLQQIEYVVLLMELAEYIMSKQRPSGRKCHQRSKMTPNSDNDCHCCPLRHHFEQQLFHFSNPWAMLIELTGEHPLCFTTSAQICKPLAHWTCTLLQDQLVSWAAERGNRYKRYALVSYLLRTYATKRLIAEAYAEIERSTKTLN